ncbi:MAG: hypothetical protein ACRDV0_03450 [Acidimicrobiales bacterium]
MAGASWRQILRGPSVKEDLGEIGDLALRHLKEQTLKPLKDLWRFVLFGAFGSVFVGFGVVLLLIGSLRYVQWQFPVFRGTLSFIPYLIVGVLALGVIALAGWRVVSGPARRRLKDDT